MKFLKVFWIEIIAGIIFLYIDFRLFLFFGIFLILYILFKHHNENVFIMRYWNLGNESKLLSIIRKLKIPIEDLGNEIFSMKERDRISQDDYEILIDDLEKIQEEFNPLSDFSLNTHKNK